MTRITAVILAAVLIGCASAPRTVATIEWVEASPAIVVELCGHTNAAGCAVVREGVCRIVTPPMPRAQFTPYHYTMTSPAWVILAHEVYHCFGHEHQPEGSLCLLREAH